jgi:enoyl-CoA hydratase
VLATIHNGCVGGGVDLISCTDMRYCSADAYFTIKEIDIGMVADVGTLQRLPKLIGNQGIVREMAFTGRKVLADEALRIGLVNQVFETREAMQAGVREMAALIASKSPLSVRGTKEMLNYSRDHSVADGLNYIATWNAAMLMSSDLTTAMMASMAKQTPQFKD